MDSDNIHGIFSKQTYSCSANEMILLFGTGLLLLILLAEFFDFGNTARPFTPKSPTTPRLKPVTPPCEPFEYGYDDHNGPSVWKCEYPAALGCRQSPINITCKNALVCPTPALNWSSEFNVIPERIRIQNDGHCVILHTKFPCNRPTISGGPLDANYDLYSIRFRWGSTDDEGSEHTIDYRRFAMELQAVHFKTGCKCEGEIKQVNNDSPNNDTVLVISYVFQTTTIDNPYLDSVLAKLDRIKYPGTATQVPPFPMCWLMPQFISDYYMYRGSMTYPPCTEGIQWIVQPEPMAVSPRQVRKFRKLVTKGCGRILSNTRPIQCINNRDIFYYTVCGDCACK